MLEKRLDEPRTVVWIDFLRIFDNIFFSYFFNDQILLFGINIYLQEFFLAWCYLLLKEIDTTIVTTIG